MRAVLNHGGSQQRQFFNLKSFCVVAAIGYFIHKSHLCIDQSDISTNQINASPNLNGRCGAQKTQASTENNSST